MFNYRIILCLNCRHEWQTVAKSTSHECCDWCGSSNVKFLVSRDKIEKGRDT